MASELMEKIVELKAVEDQLRDFLQGIENAPLLKTEYKLVEEGKAKVQAARMNFERMKGLRR